MYRSEINDPQLSNAGQTNVLFEMMFTIEQQQNFVKEFKSHGDNRKKEVKVANLNLKLARSILASDSMP
jgi:hypothetical protein